jgi:uncharacterized protein YfkK (UPF0435 family)
MIPSIFDHRYGTDSKARAGSGRDLCQALFNLLCGLLESVNRCVLAGDSYADHRGELDHVSDSLVRAESANEIAEAGSGVSRILTKYRVDSQRAAVAQVIEVQNILAMLNQALIVLSEGSDRSVSRLTHVQSMLERTRKLRDIMEMKNALADTVAFVQKEAAESRKTVTEELQRLHGELGRARESIGHAGAGLPGRNEGVAAIAEAIHNLADGCQLYLLAYACSLLPSLAQRYGNPITEELVFRVVRERVQPVARATVYRWTVSSLVTVFDRQCDLSVVTNEVNELNRSPVVHRVILGNRTAVLTMGTASLVLECSGRSAEELVHELDEFIESHS